MTNTVKIRLKQSLLVALMAAAGGFFACMSLSSGPSQAHSLTSGHMDHSLFFDSEKIDALYTRRNMQTVWFRGVGQFQPRVDAVVELLENSWTHGLNPEKYHVSKIREMQAQKNNNSNIDLDMLISDGVIRYARDLTGMRNKNSMSADLASFWRQPLPADDVITKVMGAADPIAVLRSFEPNNNLYNALRRELIALASADDADLAPIKISKPIKPDHSDAAIPLVRARLNIPATHAEANFYDDDLAAGVMRFQRAYDFEANGVIDAAIVKLLNRTNKDKMIQIIANMERLRWLDQTRPDRYVLVNIPSTTLWAVDKGEAVLEMPVIVGKTARPTYSFKTMITGVRLNPNWTVPPTIKRTDFLPMLQADPYVLAKRGIDLRVNGRSIDPGLVDWNTIGGRALHNIKMIQAPGDDNPLGKIRVIMENPYNIYLHDTNKRDVFDKKERALSSGCIRVGDPEKLAEFLLEKNDGMNHDSMMKMISSGRMRDVKVAETIPVYITYQTIWLDTQGHLIYGADVYGQDKKLAEMLEKSNSIHIPTASKNTQISL